MTRSQAGVRKLATYARRGPPSSFRFSINDTGTDKAHSDRAAARGGKAVVQPGDTSAGSPQPKEANPPSAGARGEPAAAVTWLAPRFEAVGLCYGHVLAREFRWQRPECCGPPSTTDQCSANEGPCDRWRDLCRGRNPRDEEPARRPRRYLTPRVGVCCVGKHTEDGTTCLRRRRRSGPCSFPA